MQRHDLILKREGSEFVLYEYDGTTTLKRVDGSWSDEESAKREAVANWRSHGDVYYETALNVLRVISN